MTGSPGKITNNDVISVAWQEIKRRGEATRRTIRSANAATALAFRVSCPEGEGCDQRQPDQFQSGR